MEKRVLLLMKMLKTMTFNLLIKDKFKSWGLLPNGYQLYDRTSLEL